MISSYGGVAPFTGAWIEIFQSSLHDNPVASLPSRERGLKCGSGEGSSELLRSLPIFSFLEESEVEN